jgi:CheY-like chemotaxis protein
MADTKSEETNNVKERVARHLRSADLLVKQRRHADAVKEIEKALALDPKNYYARSFLERARAQTEKNRAEAERRSDFAAAGQQEKKLEQITMLLNAAQDFIAARNYKLALQQVAKVYAIDPQNYYARAFSERIEMLIEEEKKSPRPPIVSQPPAAPEPAAPVAPVEITQQPKLRTGERASLSMYRELLRELWFDGTITDEEAEELKKVRKIFKISDQEHRDLEKQVHIEAYVEALRIAWRDGAVSQNEAEVLQMMRQKFNISMEQHMSAEANILWAKSAPLSKGSILIVDDEKAFLQSLAVYLKGRGYDIVTAESVEQALDMLKKNTPSLILADVFFGEGHLTGFEFYQRVRENPDLKGIPFLLMSGVSDEFVVRAGMRLGVDDFLQKPFDLELLLATIEGKLAS